MALRVWVSAGFGQRSMRDGHVNAWVYRPLRALGPDCTQNIDQWVALTFFDAQCCRKRCDYQDGSGPGVCFLLRDAGASLNGQRHSQDQQLADRGGCG